ncbi:SDR family NAD(P)-dependent oxidoreductase [Streptomyces sindenensis]|uniref:SDR family NAD(P)-dependent oxidoreductase n=1 Tax=Streptomyces sindenensis TaxID=67363 RepID=UPI0016722EE4|nr:SDR family NAD(P)-dependent oxidoreductase [Streptomyces sindenensis]GGP71205.1 hypothetical protein GCM10010231_47610 [Streptomyces sindenensis]
MNRQEILVALSEKRLTPDEAARLLRGETPAPASAPASVPTPASAPAPATPVPATAPPVTGPAQAGVAAGPWDQSGREQHGDDTRPSPIAIVGMSGRYASARDLETYWQLISEGGDGIREVPGSRWDMDRYYDPEIGKEGSIYCRWMGALDDIDRFDSFFFEISPSEAEMMDPQHRLFLEESYRAFEDAGYTRRTLNGVNCGVYLGLASGDYHLLCQRTPRQEEEQPSVTSVSNAIAAGRLAYYLNLKGPALTVDTACSSSLVGVHLAVQALQRGEVDMALAAGVALYLSADSYQHMCAAGMLAPDGRCKSFDNGADGFVPGEGAGAVVFKRLADAERDGDHIHGVIVASGINQDGRTNGITAPSLDSQAELVRSAYERHGIDPTSISYAELHGTGTKLGDPIELEALTTAFRNWTDRRAYCAIGSVKSNVGHTSAAAGVAGLHKILLSMRHRTLAPTLHVREPNEHFDFEQSPFYLNTGSREWQPAPGAPLRACVSSFGFSGTNAHVVVDAYTPTAAPRPRGGDRDRTFVVSAKREPQLREYARRLAAHLERHPDVDLDDVAYTLHTGREAMRERLAVVARDRAQLIDALNGFAKSGEAGPGVRRGRAANRPAEDAGWVDGAAADFSAEWSGLDPRRIPLPTYPFERESHWYPRETDPAPPAVTAGSPASSAQGPVLHPLVHRNISDFTRQRFRSDFTGAEFFLADHHVNGVPVLPGAAVVELARAAGTLSAGREVTEVTDVVWTHPVTERVVEISLLPSGEDGATFTVTTVDDEGAETTCAAGTVGFAPRTPPAALDIAALRAKCPTRLDRAALYPASISPEAGVVYGPAFQALTELAHGADDALGTLDLDLGRAGADDGFTLHPALLDGAWQAVGPFLADAEGTFVPFAVDAVRCFGPLPSSAVVHVRPAGGAGAGSRSFHLTVAGHEGTVAAEITGFTVRSTDRAAGRGEERADQPQDVFLTQRWQDEPLRPRTGTGRVLLLHTAAPGRDALVTAADVEAAAEAVPGDGFTVDGTGTRFTYRPAEPDDHGRLLRELRERGLSPDRIVLADPTPGDGPYTVHALARALAAGRPRHPVELVYAYSVPADGEPAPEALAVGGYLRCLTKEDRHVTARAVGVAPGSAARIRQELAAEPGESHAIWWQGGRRTALRSAEVGGSGEGAAFREGGVYLITGGAGGVGLILARHLSRTYGARLVIAGRTAEQDLGDAWRDADLPAGRTLYLRADVSRREDVDALVAGAKERFGRIDGVLHSAGALRDGLLRDKPAEDIAAVLAPKVAGTRHLDEALRDEPLDLFVLFSSMSAVLGNLGQSDYCYAGAYQDAFAGLRERRRRSGERSGRTLSVGWPLWADGGMRIDEDAERRLREHLGIVPLESARGCRALEHALTLGDTHVVYAPGDPVAIRRTFGLAEPEPATGSPAVPFAEPDTAPSAAPVDRLKSPLAAYLARIVSERTKRAVEKIDITDDFEVYGIDSIMMMSLTRRMEEDFGELPKTLFFEYGTIEELAGHFLDERPEDVRRVLGMTDAESKTPEPPAPAPATAAPVPAPAAATRFLPDPARAAGPAASRGANPAGPATHDIAVVGISGRYPDADDLPEFWDNLASGTDSIREVPAERWDHSQYYAPEGRTPGKAYAKWGGFVRDVDRFDPLFFNISPGEADFIDPQARLFLQTAWHAVEDAGYTRATLADHTVGVYVGVMYGMYELFQGEVKGEPTPVSSSFAAIANRVSYVLNLRGPSMAVDTMCSSSLTALHLACESIRRGESDMAIAGGVNLTIHPNKLILLSQGNFAATDGRCRSFGEGGDGYVPGEGVGAVVLKSLDRAIADGDHIHAVIKGSALNSGGRTTGFTVPNPNAQAALVRNGLADAGVDARSISCIEAHGTGTALGDPIEVTALTQAFRTQTPDVGFCSIGSVKSNIGHLESAAGIAALTKVILQLKHRKLVPSLHAATLNPFIDFERSPFRVQRELADWAETGAQPRRAGISSFGAGGANAHLVVEEFIDDRSAPADSGPFLFVYSARDEERLRELVARHLVAARAGFDGAALASVAYTLQTGREAMECRLAVVADSAGELATLLEGYLARDHGSPRLVTGDTRGAKRQSTLLDLIEDSDMTARLLRERRFDKAAELWVEGVALDWSQLHGSRPPQRVPLPGYAFAKERCWVTGFAQAPAAGAATERLHPLLHRNSSTLEGLRFSSTFTGGEFFLSDHRVGGRPMLPAVAYLEMALAAVRSALPAQARDTDLSVRDVVWLRPFALGDGARELHITLSPGAGQETVAFRIHGDHTHCQGEVGLGPAAGPEHTVDLDEVRARCDRPRVEGAWCYRAFTHMGIDYGRSHQAIGTVHRGAEEALVALRLPDGVATDGFTLHPALLDAALQSTLALGLPETLPDDPAALGSDGASAELPFAVEAVEVIRPTEPVMWAHLRRATGTGGDRMKRVDITLCDAEGRASVLLRGVAFKTFDYEPRAAAEERLLFAPRWRESDPEPAPEGPARFDRWVVLLGDGAPVTAADLGRSLPEADCRTLDSGVPADPARRGERYLDQTVELLRRVRELVREHRGGRLLVHLVAADGHSLGLAGLLGTLRTEHPAVSVQMLDCRDVPPAVVLAERLRAERLWPTAQVVRYTGGGRREVRRWEELPAPAEEPTAPLWRAGGVYVITGGAGGLGLLMADEIARSVPDVRLVLTGRSAPGARTEEALTGLRAHGAVAEYAQTDVTDAAAVSALIARVSAEHGGPHGVLHCAGVTRDKLITAKEPEDARAVLAPKTVGAVALDEATARLPLEFFLLFSSVAGALGNAGQADYAAGNAFLDRFASYREELVARGERHGRTLSVNWQLWRDGGMGVAAEQVRAAADLAGLAVLDRATGLGVLAACVASGEPQVLPLVGNAVKLRAYLRAQTTNAPEPETAGADRAAGGEGGPAVAGRAELLAEAIKEVIADEIKLDAARIDAYLALENYGIDSVLIINLTQRLEEDFGPLAKTIFFENQTVMELAEALSRSHPDETAGLLARRSGAVARAEEPAAGPRAGTRGDGVPDTRTPAAWSPLWGSAADRRTPERSGGSGMDIAIVGVAGRYPQAEDLAAFWTNLRKGRDSVTEIPADRWDHAPFHRPEPGRQDATYARWGGFIDDAACFDSLFFNISPGEAEIMDPQERVFLECVHHTLEDAGYSRRSLTGRPVGVYVGVMYEEYQLYAAQQQLRGEMATLNGSAASIANRVSYHYGLHGPSMAVDTMCSSSLVAIHLAAQSLRSGECEAAIAGGVNLSLHPNKFLMLGKNRFAATDGRCRTFGEGGDGYVPGEGVGAVLLKPLARAEADGDHIHGVIKGTAVSHDGKTNGYTVPNPHAQTAVIERALERAAVDSRDITYVEAHGTGTRLGDPLEVAALTKAFGGPDAGAARCHLGSAKSNIGHCESAAGIAGVSKVLLQLRNREIVPSLHSATLNPEIDFAATPFTVPQEVIPWEVDPSRTRIAGISSFGAGGTNAHVVIGEYRAPDRPVPEDPGGPLVIPLSARREDQLRGVVSQLLDWLRARRLTPAELADVAHTLRVGRDSYEERLGLLVRSQDELETALGDFLAGRPVGHRGRGVTPAPAAHADALYEQYRAGRFDEVLDAWAAGQDLDWDRLAASGARSRIPLPVYPFARLRHWHPPHGTAAPLAPVPPAAAVQGLHPLLHQNRSSLFEQRFTAAFTGEEAFLDGHRVEGRRVLPGSVSLEMARLAGALSLEREVRSVRNVLWRHPVVVADEPVETTVRLYPEEDSVLVRIGVDQGPPEARICMEARISPDPASLEPFGRAGALDLAEVVAGCDGRLSGSAVYATMAEAGLYNGPAFQVIEEVLFRDGEAVVQLALPSAADRHEADVLPPALVNGAFQAVSVLMAGHGSGLLLPFSIGSVDIRGPLPDECVAHLRHRGADGGTTVDRFDITLTDLAGTALVVVRDYALKSLPDAAQDR